MIQEKQLLTMNCLLPAERRPLTIGDQEARARHLLGLSIIGELKESEVVGALLTVTVNSLNMMGWEEEQVIAQRSSLC